MHTLRFRFWLKGLFHGLLSARRTNRRLRRKAARQQARPQVEPLERIELPNGLLGAIFSDLSPASLLNLVRAPASSPAPTEATSAWSPAWTISSQSEPVSPPRADGVLSASIWSLGSAGDVLRDPLNPEDDTTGDPSQVPSLADLVAYGSDLADGGPGGSASGASVSGAGSAAASVEGAGGAGKAGQLPDQYALELMAAGQLPAPLAIGGSQGTDLTHSPARAQAQGFASGQTMGAPPGQGQPGIDGPLSLTGAGTIASQPESGTSSPQSASASSSLGTDFWLTFPGNFPEFSTPELTLFITSAVTTTGTVAIPGLDFATDFSVTAGTATAVTLPTDAELQASDLVEDKGIHVTAVDEVSVYGLNYSLFTTDSYLGLPTAALGTEYIVLGYNNADVVNGTQLAIVGTADTTTVTITPSVTTDGHPAGVPYDITLDEGQTYQLRNTDGPPSDLPGTVVGADKPIAVFGGHQCANIPSDPLAEACTHLVEQLPPTESWGMDFVTMPLATRQNGDTFRFLAAQDETEVQVNGSPVATLNRGEIHEQIIPEPAYITANQPILVAQYANGSEFSGQPGDPSMMLLPAADQFLDRYTVATPASGFSTNYLNVVAPNEAVGTITLDGDPIPAGSFVAIGSSGFSGAQVAVSVGDHNLDGPTPFGVWVYGFATDDAYSHPAGMSFMPFTPFEGPDIYSNSEPPSGFHGDPQDTGGDARGVYLHNGEFHYRAVDLEIPGRGFNWRFERAYRSDVAFDSRLGHNWDFKDNRRLRLVTAANLSEIQLTFPQAQPGDVVRLDGLNRADLYVYDPGTDPFTAPAGFFTRLLQHDDGSFSERDQSGTVFSYSAPGMADVARITRIVDRVGNTMHYQYDAAGRLEHVIDTLGRSIDYFYFSNGRLKEVHDFLGRVLKFNYSSRGDLETVTSPAVTGTPTGNNFPLGKTERYAYSFGFDDRLLNHNLLTITAPTQEALGGPPRLVLSYDETPGSPDLDRVYRQELGGTNDTDIPAGGFIDYAYQALPLPQPDGAVSQMMVTDRNGNETVYRFDAANNILSQEERTNRDVRPGDPPSFVTRWEWNTDFLLTQQTFPEGNTIAYDYDDESLDRFQQGNLRETVRTADPDRGGDQALLTTRSSYEPIYNQLRTVVDPRGTDPTYVPPNGGTTSEDRYQTTYVYDYQEGMDFEGLAQVLGVTAAEVEQLLIEAGTPMDLGDVNDDGRTDQIAGNLIRIESPIVNLLPGSNQAAVEGDTEQQIAQQYRYNDFGQVIASVDPEENVDHYAYYPENDPDGDGQDLTPGRDPDTGGYLAQVTRDVEPGAGRNSGTNPEPTAIRHRYHYDRVGNVIREVDGRGIATDYVVNQLNQVVQVTRAADVNVFPPSPGEPHILVPFQFVERTFYDFNDNVVLRQVEDFGNTSNVDGNLSVDDLPAGVPGVLDADPFGGTAFVDMAYRYDILDQQVAMVQEVSNGLNPEFLRTRYRYDPNGHQVLTILPEQNATSAVYDERDLVFQTTRGALEPPPLVLLAGNDPVDYDARGGLLCQCTTYHYDGNRNVIETVDAADTDGSADNNSDRGGPGDRTRYVFDGFDRPTSSIDSVGNQSVTQYDPAGNVVRVLQFGPVGGASPTSDGPDVLPGPVSDGGVVLIDNLVSDNLLAASESLHDELSRVFQSDQVLFVNTIATMRGPDVDDGAADIGKGDLTPGDDDPIPGIPGAANGGVDILGRVSTRTEYDRNSRVTFSVEDDTDTARTFYDGANRAIRTVDPEGNTVETAYDDNSNVIETREIDVSQVAGVDPEVFLTTNFYDSLNRLERTVDNLGQALYYRYDSRDNLVAMADAQGQESAEVFARRFFPDGPRTVNAINAFGNVTRYFYDGLGRQTLLEVILTESGAGDGAHIGASLFGVKEDMDEPESFTPDPAPGQGGGDGLIRTGFLWDQNSLQTALLDDQGNITLWLFDNQDRAVTETKGVTVSTLLTEEAVLGDRLVVTPTRATINDPAFIPETKIDLQLADVQARIDLLASLFPTLADQIDPPTTIVTGYDAEGNVLIREDENDTETFTKFDALNRAVAVRVFRNGQGDDHRNDPLFPLLPVSDPSNPTTVTAVVGTTIQDFQYDGLSRQALATDNNDPTRGDDDSAITFAFDSLSRLLEETQQIGGRNARAVSSGWRSDGLRTRLTYPDDRVVLTTFDELDRVDTIAEAGAAEPIADYNYIGTYRVLERLSPLNDTRLTYLNDDGNLAEGYDGLRRPVQLRHLRDADDTVVVGFTHSYDRMSNKLSEGKLHSLENSETYAYDSAYRLVSFDRAQTIVLEDSGLLDSANGQTDLTLFDPAKSWGPDQWLGRKVRIVAGPGVGQVRSILTNSEMVLTVDQPWDELPGPGTAYEIFRAGQEADDSQWALDGVGNWSLVDGSEDWQHTTFNEITSFGPGGTVVQSDDNGNETSEGGFTFQYDFQNRLRVSQTVGGALVGVYSYDAAGRRIRQVVSNSPGLDGTTDFYLDGSQEIEERGAADTVVQQYVFGISIDEPLVLDYNMDSNGPANGPGDRRLFYHQNTLGSVFALTDGAGNVEEGYLYDAYGTQTVYTPGPDGVVNFGGDDFIPENGVSVLLNPFLYTGRRFDGETDLYYYRARYFDADQGRFIQRDVMGYAAGINLYSYVANNPASAVDPLGMFLIGAGCKCNAAVWSLGFWCCWPATATCTPTCIRTMNSFCCRFCCAWLSAQPTPNSTTLNICMNMCMLGTPGNPGVGRGFSPPPAGCGCANCF